MNRQHPFDHHCRAAVHTLLSLFHTTHPEQGSTRSRFGCKLRTYLHKLRARELEENGVGLFSAGSREERLSRPRRPVQQDTLRGSDANVVEHVLVGHGQHHGLDQLLDLFVQA